MLRRRQSSPGIPSSQEKSQASSSRFHPSRATCGLTLPYCFELRTPSHGSSFAGGLKRFAPAVEAAYGMPLKVGMPLRI